MTTDHTDADGTSDRVKGNKDFPIAEVVSLESLVNLLIRKGICSPEELYIEEQERRQALSAEKGPHFVQTTRELEHVANGEPGHRKSGWLKKKMSKRRWTRKLGTALLGWEWKKVKVQRPKPGRDDQI